MTAALVVERIETPRGELVLRRSGRDFEVISNGTFLMDTRGGDSERLLVSTALAAHHTPRELLIGGLGVGFSLTAAVSDARLQRIVTVEIEPTVVKWNRSYLADHNRHALDDPRVQVVETDLLRFLEQSPDRFDVICLDIDNGPDWTVTEANAGLYDEAGTSLVASRLRPGGVLSVWSSARSPSYLALLSGRFDRVDVLEVPVHRGEPDVVMVASTNPPSRCTTEAWQP